MPLNAPQSFIHTPPETPSNTLLALVISKESLPAFRGYVNGFFRYYPCVTRQIPLPVCGGIQALPVAGALGALAQESSTVHYQTRGGARIAPFHRPNTSSPLAAQEDPVDVSDAQIR